MSITRKILKTQTETFHGLLLFLTLMKLSPFVEDYEDTFSTEIEHTCVWYLNKSGAL